MHVPYAYGFAIILLTVIVKAATYPLTKQQVNIGIMFIIEFFPSLIYKFKWLSVQKVMTVTYSSNLWKRETLFREIFAELHLPIY